MDWHEKHTMFLEHAAGWQWLHWLMHKDQPDFFDATGKCSLDPGPSFGSHTPGAQGEYKNRHYCRRMVS